LWDRADIKGKIAMRSETRTRFLNIIRFSSLLILMGIVDWDHFFPVSTRPDLLFQVTGEFFELTALVGLLLLMSFGIEKVRNDSEIIRFKFIYGLLVAASFSLFLLALSWRDFFSNHQFSWHAVSLRHIAGVLFSGLAFAVVGFALQSRPGRPIKERRGSLV
jgi:hypothetical protein